MSLRLPALAALACLVGLAACGDGGATVGAGHNESVSGRELSLRQQVGQLLLLKFDGQEVPRYVRRLLQSERTAGAVLFADNVGNPADVRRLTRELQAAAGGDALIATDDEGGALMNVPTTPPLPAQPALNGQTEQAVRAAGRNLLQQGVNVNLAPVADLSGPVTGGRAFAGGPAEVATHVRAAVRGYRGASVAATVKHFPGLGGASDSTDDAPVTIHSSRDELERGLIPFQAAIAERVPVVMASHGLYPALDPRHIASQSHRVLGSLLRERLGFDGVVITDSIEADAVIRRSSVEAAAERSIEAGADLILMTGRGSWIRVYPGLLARARSDASFRKDVRLAAGRVIALKQRLRMRP